MHEIDAKLKNYRCVVFSSRVRNESLEIEQIELELLILQRFEKPYYFEVLYCFDRL